MDTHNHILRLATYNNAVWCDTICRSHNVPGKFHEDFWVCPQQTPTYYPNLVTLSPTTSLDPQQSTLAAILGENKEYGVSVKDSFAVLDLTPAGFRQLFQAQWIFHEATTGNVPPETSDLCWELIGSIEKLQQWEEAWAQTDSLSSRLFLPTLLDDADIGFVAGYKDQQIVAGAIANRTEGAVGISNVFTPEQNAEQYWLGLLNQITIHYPTLPIVGYEQDESLATALRVGFTKLGPLTVWIK
jgi:hypothetical protein